MQSRLYGVNIVSIVDTCHDIPVQHVLVNSVIEKNDMTQWLSSGLYTSVPGCTAASRASRFHPVTVDRHCQLYQCSSA